MDQRTELGVYISSEFCCEASSFIFLEGGTPSRSLGVGRWGREEEKRKQVDTPGEQLGSAGKLQVEEWASEVLTLWPGMDLEGFTDLPGATHPSYSYVHQVTSSSNCSLPAGYYVCSFKFALQDQRLDQPGCIDNSSSGLSTDVYGMHTCWLFWGKGL